MTGAPHRARSLAAALRDVRDNADVSAREIGRKLGRSHTTVTRWLSGEITPSAEDVAAFLAVIGITGDDRNRILTIARASDDSDWLISGPAGVTPQLASVMDYERTAIRVTEWSPLIVPGSLQTSDYATAIIRRSSPTIEASEIEGRVFVRMGRQAAFTRLDPIELRAIIGVPAIRGRIGGPRVMAAQLQHLHDMQNKHPNVTIQAFDLEAAGEWSPAHAGQFILYEFADLPPVVYLEHHRTGSFVVDEQDVADYQTAAEIIRREAMSPDQTARLIADAIPNTSLETTG